MQVLRLGDGQCICEKCWQREREANIPIFGWIAGECDYCREVRENGVLITDREGK